MQLIVIIMSISVNQSVATLPPLRLKPKAIRGGGWRLREDLRRGGWLCRCVAEVDGDALGAGTIVGTIDCGVETSGKYKSSVDIDVGEEVGIG